MKTKGEKVLVLLVSIAGAALFMAAGFWYYGQSEDTAFHKTLAEINRVLRKDGLLFLVENTTVKSNGGHWVFRSTDEYIDMFPFMKLVHLHDYFDLGERISIMAGRKFR